MHKKILSFLLIVLLLLSLSGCSFKEFSEKLGFLPEEEHLYFPSLGNNRIEYQGNAYYKCPPYTFSIRDDFYIGWNGSQWYRQFVYVDSPDSPMFISFNGSYTVYMREDYDYTADEFQIEGTDFTFCFGEHLSLTEEPFDYDPFNGYNESIVVHSINFPKLQLGFHITKENDTICFFVGNFLVQCSESFIQELKNLKIIEWL